MRFSENILLYTLIPLIVLSISASYFRFMVTHDYVVAYEGVCDPVVDTCFIGCMDDECTEEYYYTIVEKHATTIFAQCGNDITDCQLANICLPEDGEICSVTFCDIELDGEACEILTEEDILEEESETIDANEISHDAEEDNMNP